MNNNNRYDLNNLLDILTIPMLKDTKFAVDEATGVFVDTEWQEIVLEDSVVYLSFCKGNVRVDAYLPIRDGIEMSCVVRFRGNGFFFGFTQEQLERVLFSPSGTALEKQRFFVGYDDEQPILQLTNTRLTTDLKTADDLVIALETLQAERQRKHDRIH